MIRFRFSSISENRKIVCLAEGRVLMLSCRGESLGVVLPREES